MTAALLVARLAPATATDLEVQAARTLVIVVFLIVGLRVFGKRLISQINLYDLAMLMALSNAVQNAMTGGRGNLTVGLVTSSTIVLASWGLTRLLSVRRGGEQLVVGTPIVVVSHGRVLTRRVRRAGLTPDDLSASLRKRGLDDPREAALVVLEVDGSISVVPRSEDDGSTPKPKRKRRRAERSRRSRARRHR